MSVVFWFFTFFSFFSTFFLFVVRSLFRRALFLLLFKRRRRL